MIRLILLIATIVWARGLAAEATPEKESFILEPASLASGAQAATLRLASTAPAGFSTNSSKQPAIKFSAGATLVAGSFKLLNANEAECKVDIGQDVFGTVEVSIELYSVNGTKVLSTLKGTLGVLGPSAVGGVSVSVESVPIVQANVPTPQNAGVIVLSGPLNGALKVVAPTGAHFSAAPVVVSGAGITGAALADGPSAATEQAGRDLSRWATPEEQWTPSICQQCPAGCGLLVRTMDGEAVGLRGNPVHPVNRGALCPKPFGALQALHDTDRYRGPMMREGERGSGRFKSIGWDEALGLVTQRLGDLRSQGRAHTVVTLGGQYRGLRDALWARFTQAYGTPNYVRMRCLAPERPALTHRLMQGVTSPLTYDLERAQLILVFGAGLLESWLSPVAAGRALAALRDGGGRARGALVVVDPRRSLSAAAADRWVPIRPGTDGILALGIAHVLLREGLHDRTFVERETTGFEDWTDATGRRHRGLKTVVLEDYGPLPVAAATGVPVETITSVARELGRARPALVIGERGPAFGPGDLATRMAIHALNALVGSIGIEGGLTLAGELPLAPLPSVKTDEVARRGAGHPRLDGAGEGPYRLAPDVPQVLPARILAGQPYPVNALFLMATNPVANHPAGGEFAAALARIPLVVSFSPFPDESTRLADLILPDHAFLERWQDDPVTHLAGFACWSLGRPAALPRHQTRSTGDVLLQLAKRLGGGVAESLGWEKYEDLLYESARGLHEAKRGYVGAPREDERQGRWSPEFESYDDFWEALVKRGAWWDPAPPPSRRGLFKTRSGKLQLFAADPIGEVLARPEPESPAAVTDESFPLILNTYRLATRPAGGGGNQPWLVESAAVPVGGAWRSWVEIHPEDAGRLAVKNGDPVWVESSKGRLRLGARVRTGGLPGVVHIPLYGSGSENPNALIVDMPDRTRGMGLFTATRVRVRKA